jgi:hypothetical protein
MNLATKRDLDAFRQRRYATTVIRGLTFRVQNLSELEQATLDAEMLGADGKPSSEGLARARIRLIIAAWVDEHGRKICSDQDELLVGALDTSVSIPLAEFIQEHCGATDHSAEAFEGIIKNCEETPAGALPTGSHSRWAPSMSMGS